MNLFGTNDKLEMVSGAAATIDVVSSFSDLQNAGSGTQRVVPGVQRAAFSTASTADLVAASAAPTTTVRRVDEISIRNKHATTTSTVTVQINANGTVYEIIRYALKPGETLLYKDGVGWIPSQPSSTQLFNESVSAVTGYAADTYLVGSNILLPSGVPLVGTTYKLKFDVTRTSAGTAAPVVTVRYGTAGTTGDTARVTFTWAVGSGVADQGVIDVICVFRTVGSGTAAVLQGTAELKHQLASTGLTTTGTAGYASLYVTSSGFDSTPAGSQIGASYNGGASASHTINLVRAELVV